MPQINHPYGQPEDYGGSNGEAGGGTGGGGLSASDIAKAVEEGTSAAAIRAERRILERRLDRNNQKYDLVKQNLNKKINEMVKVSKGQFVCSAFCGAFDSDGVLVLKSLNAAAATDALAYKK